MVRESGGLVECGGGRGFEGSDNVREEYQGVKREEGGFGK